MIFFLLISMIFLLISPVSSCRLKTRVISETYHPVWAQFTFHNGTESEVYEFTENNQNHTLYIVGPICNLKPTILKTYNEKIGPGVKPIGQTSAFIEGQGMLDYTVYHKDPPRMGMRIGVSCGFGDCGSRG